MAKIDMRGLEEYRKLYEEDKAISLFLYDIIFPDISFNALTPKGQERILMIGKAVEKIIKESKEEFFEDGKRFLEENEVSLGFIRKFEKEFEKNPKEKHGK